MPVVHDFDAKLAESDNNRVRALVHKALQDRFGGDYRQIHKAALVNDRHGADYLAEFRHGQTRLIEAKVRAQDWLPRGQEADLALETWADIDKQVAGWTRDPAKLSDYVVFVWLESGRSLLLDARLLRAWFVQQWQKLRTRHGFRIIPSKRRGHEWRSEAVYVPHREVVAQLAYRQGYVHKPPGSSESDSRREPLPAQARNHSNRLQKVPMTIKSRVEKLEERTTPDQQVLFIRCRPRDGETLDQARDRWLAEHGMTKDDLERFRYVYIFGI